MAKKKKNSDGYDGDSYDDGGQLTLDEQLFEADKRHYRTTEQYVGQVDRIYRQAITDLANLASQMQQLPQSQSFEFSRNPRLAAAAETTLRTLATRIEAIVDAGCRHEWEAACIKGDKYVQRIHATSGLSKEQIQRYQDRNLEALAAFQERKVEGMNLSERVWKMVSPLKDEVELAVDTSAKYFDHGVGINTKDSITKIQSAIGTGMSAADLSRDVRQCLLEPNKLFRRVKDKHGNLTLSKAAKLYHPGQGVYRSSYKNAMRLTRSEINMAYRQSDTMRWQQLDFVVGMEVHTSNNHTTTDPKSKGKLQLIDICDELKGKYPRDFKFVGWHPQCRCYMTPILKTRDEMNEDRENADNPDYVPKPSVNAVTDTPKGFQQYMQDNAERIAGWSSTPYYIKDNHHYFDKALHPEKYQVQALTLTAEQSKLLSEFQAYANNHQGSKQFASALADAQKAMLTGDQKAFDAAMTSMGGIQARNERVHVYTAKRKYDSYSDEWEKAIFDNETGGFNVYHAGHQFSNAPIKDASNKAVPGLLTGGEAEKLVGEVLARKYGKQIEFLKENKVAGNADLSFDGQTWDIKYVPIANQETIRKYIKNAEKAQNVIFYAGDRDRIQDIHAATNSELGNYIKKGTLDKMPNVLYVDADGTVHEIYTKNGGYCSAWRVQKSDISILSHGAKLTNVTETTKFQQRNNTQKQNDSNNLKPKRAKSAKERRHEWDERIAELKAKATKYHIDTEAIDQAYTSLDLKKLEQAVTSQEQALARRTKTYAVAEKRHKQRTQADVETMQTEWNMRRAKAYGLDKHIAEAQELVITHGIDRKTIDAFLASKQGKTRAEFEAKMAEFNKAIEGAKNEMEINGLVRMTELSGLGHQLKAEGGAKATRLAKKVQDLNKSLMKRKDSVAYVNSKEYQQIIQNTERQLNEIKAHRAEVSQRAKEWAKKRESSIGETKLTKTLDALKRSGIETLHVKKLPQTLSDEEIIARVGGGDRTKGSCSSLALCFAGNKGGLDVLDFRDGESRKFFATTFNIKRFIREAGGLIEYDTDDNEASKRLWSTMQPGKYYYFATGCHAAIIRLRKEGRKTIREYLELQTPYKEDNKFNQLNKQKLKSRFGAEFDQAIPCASMMIDIDLLIKDPGFRKMLEYINTESSKQNKGGGGYAK